VLRWGTGALNIDGCRVPVVGDRRSPCGADGVQHRRTGGVYGEHKPTAGFEGGARWPANLCHDASEEVLAAFDLFGERRPCGNVTPTSRGLGYMGGAQGATNAEFHKDTGSAARFFQSCPLSPEELRFHYSAKAGRVDRAGSKHPTVKPVSLMRWLVRMVTPPGGIVLDCFAGSGTTGAAALAEGFHAVLIEREAEYVADIRRRLAA
jgi:site-specific DNA-methyltransferase (adenine-specific)